MQGFTSTGAMREILLTMLLMPRLRWPCCRCNSGITPEPDFEYIQTPSVFAELFTPPPQCSSMGPPRQTLCAAGHAHSRPSKSSSIRFATWTLASGVWHTTRYAYRSSHTDVNFWCSGKQAPLVRNTQSGPERCSKDHLGLLPHCAQEAAPTLAKQTHGDVVQDADN